MDGKQRREKIIELMKSSGEPLAGGTLARKFGVSRQVIVQDIALLRAANYKIVSTNRGYVCVGPLAASRVFYVNHATEQIRQELNIIVDYGGTVVDVFVEHEPYGRLQAPLDVRNRSQVQSFIDGINQGTSSPLMTITSGYHYHTVEARSEEILDVIEEQLKKSGFLVEKTE
ncbi:MAG: transcription repressor NadR [Blautia sp.]